MNLVFNELSLNGNIQNQMQQFEHFLKLYTKLVNSSIGFSRDILTCVDLNSIEISNNYYVAQWRNTHSVDRELRMLFKRICDRQIIITSNDDCEVYYAGKAGKGLTIAYVDGFPIISIDDNQKWSPAIVKCNLYSLIDDAIHEIEIRNFSNDISINDNEEYIKSIKSTELKIDIDDGFVNVVRYFPHLIFSNVAINQLSHDIEKQHINTIVRKLNMLEKYFSEWDGSTFNPEAFPTKSVSPESQETLKRYCTEHTFVFEEGIGSVIASWHIRYTGNIPGRIYFVPKCELKKGLICSLTTKLPTVSNPKSKVR